MSQSGNQPGSKAGDTSDDTSDDRPVLPPPAPEQVAAQQAAAEREAEKRERAAAKQRARAERQDAKQAAARQKAEQKAQQKAEQHAAQLAQSAQQSGAPASRGRGTSSAAPRRTRKAQLRLVQVDAWSVMKTSFLLSIALGIVLVVAVAIVWAVLGAAGVWDSINSIVQQAVGNAEGPQFDVTDYVGTSRVLGFAMLVAALDVVLITAIATLGAFLYNLSAALLGGVEVTLAEDH